MTENEKELLLAAKAVGIKPDTSETNGGGIGNTGFDMNGDMVLDWHNNIKWNPRKYYADAFQLAIKLRLDIEHNNPLDNNNYVYVSRCGIEMCRDPVGIHEEFEDEIERELATCFAITRAAAEIARKMQ